MGRVQQNAVLVKGKQTVIIVAMKSTEASTLDVVNGIKKMIPRAEQISPEGVEIKLLDDASTFVKDSIADVLHEMATAGALVGLIVLLLLGSWRATVIVWTSIPLSILTALIGLHWLNETINVMTLGGLALAVGILVDDATVMIENIDRHLEMGKPLAQGKAETEKCALACRYFADHAAQMLADDHIPTEYSQSYVAYRPLGTVLAIMPWNFPIFLTWMRVLLIPVFTALFFLPKGVSTTTPSTGWRPPFSPSLTRSRPPPPRR